MAVNVLVLGGTGFIGRHAVAALRARGHRLVVGTRDPRRAAAALAPPIGLRRVRFERLRDAAAWLAIVGGADVVVNCVGILRERGIETYDRVHRVAVSGLAGACARAGVARLVHVSALGLHASARSGFIRSKLDGERAVVASGIVSTIVRPSLLDGEGGYGARWLRRVARWPVHFVPADSRGCICVLDVRDLADALATLCEVPATEGSSIVELGGPHPCTIAEHLARLRAGYGLAPARCIVVPRWVARATSHACDVLHVSPFSFGHLELLRRDNVPARDPRATPVVVDRVIGTAMRRAEAGQAVASLAGRPA